MHPNEIAVYMGTTITPIGWETLFEAVLRGGAYYEAFAEMERRQYLRSVA